MSNNNIDPKEYGQVLARVAMLEKQLELMQSDIRQIAKILNEAQGGWKTMVIVGSAAATVGAFIPQMISFFKRG